MRLLTLSDGSTVGFFVDKSTIILEPSGSTFTYLPPHGSAHNGGVPERQTTAFCHIAMRPKLKVVLDFRNTSCSSSLLHGTFQPYVCRNLFQDELLPVSSLPDNSVRWPLTCDSNLVEIREDSSVVISAFPLPLFPTPARVILSPSGFLVDTNYHVSVPSLDPLCAYNAENSAGNCVVEVRNLFSARSAPEQFRHPIELAKKLHHKIFVEGCELGESKKNKASSASKTAATSDGYFLAKLPVCSVADSRPSWSAFSHKDERPFANSPGYNYNYNYNYNTNTNTQQINKTPTASTFSVSEVSERSERALRQADGYDGYIHY